MIVAPPLNGGEDFAGKIGRKTASACEISARQTSVIAAPYFMSRGVIRLRRPDKKNFQAGVEHA